MKHLFLVLAAVFLLGAFGFSAIEDMTLADSLLSTASVMSTTGIPDGLSQPGKIFTTVLLISSMTIVVMMFIHFFSAPQEAEEEISGFFDAPNDGMIMKELSVTASSQLAGLRKSQVIEKFGAIVAGVRQKGGFDVNIPLTARVKKGSTVLLMGTPASLARLEKKRK